MRIIAASALFFGLWAGLSNPVAANYIDGNKLHDECSAKSGESTYYQKRAFCYAYITGAVDALQQERIMSGNGQCIPGNVTIGQLRDIVAAYLQANPGRRHYSGYILVNLAVSESFNCSFKRQGADQ